MSQDKAKSEVDADVNEEDLSLVTQVLRGTAGLVAYSLRTFALSHLLIDIIFGLALAALCYWIAADGSWVRGVLAGIVAFMMCLLLGVILSVKLTVFFAISRAIKKAALGSRIFDALFEWVLGVRDDKPRGDGLFAESVQGLTVLEVQQRLNRAASDLLTHDTISRNLPRFVRWMANKVQRVAVWAVVRVVITQCASGAGPESRIDLVELRDRLAGTIDGQVESQLRGSARRFVLTASTVVVVVACLIAWGIRQLPL